VLTKRISRFRVHVQDQASDAAESICRVLPERRDATDACTCSPFGASSTWCPKMPGGRLPTTGSSLPLQAGSEAVAEHNRRFDSVRKHRKALQHAEGC